MGALVGRAVSGRGGAVLGGTLGAVVGALASRRRKRIAGVAEYLQRHLGRPVTAYLSGIQDTETVEGWASGTLQPTPASDVRLRYAYDAARCLVDVYDDETAQSWFLGMNPYLDDDAPAYVLLHGQGPEDWNSVVSAARAFVENAR